MINLNVHVEYDDGSEASDAKVFLDIHSWPASTWLEGYTDRSGDVSFELDESDNIEITFYVDGDEYQTESISDGDSIYITKY
ncbi:MAG: hypothetical protein AB2L20_08920 [Mangrovibacterium sp.]